MQAGICPDEKVGARYQSSKAVSVSASYHTFRGFPPRPVVEVDSSVYMCGGIYTPMNNHRKIY
jgi:hypothetical protein